MASYLPLVQSTQVGGPAHSPATGFFFSAGGQKKNLRREGHFFNAPQQDGRPSSPTSPFHQRPGGPRWTCILQCNKCGNLYKSRRSCVRNWYPRAATLADFWFALIGVCISHAPRLMETYFLTIVAIERRFLHTTPLSSHAPPVISSPHAYLLNSASGPSMEPRGEWSGVQRGGQSGMQQQQKQQQDSGGGRLKQQSNMRWRQREH